MSHTQCTCEDPPPCVPIFFAEANEGCLAEGQARGGTGATTVAVPSPIDDGGGIRDDGGVERYSRHQARLGSSGLRRSPRSASDSGQTPSLPILTRGHDHRPQYLHYSSTRQQPQQQLLHNLRIYGWSPVRVVDRVGPVTGEQWKAQALASLFSSNGELEAVRSRTWPPSLSSGSPPSPLSKKLPSPVRTSLTTSTCTPKALTTGTTANKIATRTTNSGAFAFRTSESGNPNVVEPKQSWEYLPRYTPCRGGWRDHGGDHEEDAGGVASDDDNDEEAGERSTAPLPPADVTSLLTGWACTLRSVADRVREELQLPPEFLSSTQGPEDAPCVDVLRVFCYDAVPPTSPVGLVGSGAGVEGDAPSSVVKVMGSSPHTDWGSLTVVYQDNVGGLQTRCPICGEWRDVRSNTPKEPATSEPAGGGMEFVVHVGDVTSLAIGQALLLTQPQHENEQGEGEGDDPGETARTTTTVSPSKRLKTSDDVANSTPFPSPLHRVLSPSAERRVSFVYFAYPPPDARLRALIQALQSSWPHLSSMPPLGATDLRLDDYYLLRDQKHPGTPSDAGAAASERLERILDRPIGDVLQEKWDQVQRDY